MKKYLYAFTACGMAIGLGLTACDSGPRVAPPTAGIEKATAASTGVRLDANYDSALPVIAQLLLGTIQLEGTPNVLNSATAAQLLPLWQKVKDLQTDPNAQPQDLDGPVEQIQAAMSPAQIQAIANMRLTQADMNSTLQQMGVSIPSSLDSTPSAVTYTREPGNGGPMGTLSPDQLATLQAGGGFPGGRPGGGRPMGTLSPNQLATLQAGGRFGGQQPSGTPAADPLGTLPAIIEMPRLSPALLDVMIHLLQTKASS